MQRMNEKAWLFHRGTWKQIKNPLPSRESPDVIDRRQSLYEYRRRWWTFGPTFLYPDYSGLLLYTYIYEGTRDLPTFLIWMNACGLSEIIYAQDLPDLLEILDRLAPLVITGIFVDVYKRSQQRE